MKKMLVIPVLLVILAALVFGGCAAPAPTTPTPAPTTPTPAPTTPTPAPTTPTPAPTTPTPAPPTTTAPKPPAGTKVIELSLNEPIASNHLRWVHLVQPWCAEVEKRTNNRVKFTPYFAGSLATMATNVEAVTSGICDLAEGSTNEITGRFPLAELCNLPLWSPDSVVCSKALWEATKKIPAMQNEWRGMKILSVANWMPIHVSGTFPIKTAADLKGKKINGIGGTKPDVIRAFGGIPTSIGTGDLYMALQKGITDAGIYGPEPLWSRKWGEFWKYSADYSFGANTFYLVMNQSKWDKLPADIQKIIDEMSGEPLALAYGKAANENHDEAIELLVKNLNHDFYKLPPDETAKWLELAKASSRKYIADLEAKGLPAKLAFDTMMELMPQKLSLD